MSHESILYGCIIGPERPDIYNLFPLNLEIIQSLPEVDDYPPVSRSMFSIPADNSLSGWYRTQVIHFGASISEFVEDDWEEWLLKFESLLRNLFWRKVYLHLITELQGSYNYTWEADIDASQLRWTMPTLDQLKPAL